MKAKVTIEIFIDDYVYESSPEEKKMKLDSLRLSAEVMNVSMPSGYQQKAIAVSVQQIEQLT